ncbi:hypothetical protein E2C01_060108 [Portunus trituberculatus]|uniref:Uncharacterized protein n=1 Tax=Portunus trituberculatus TaxID=210409 RepID=A0A5B7H9K1_PORTR|nr:hypothetical protein [Portunus trituberculatus]
MSPESQFPNENHMQHFEQIFGRERRGRESNCRGRVAGSVGSNSDGAADTLLLGQEKYKDAVTMPARPPQACGYFWTVWGKKSIRSKKPRGIDGGALLALGRREAQDKWLKCKTNSTYYVNERVRPPSSRRVRACRRDSQGKLCIVQVNSLSNQADTNPRRHGRHHHALLGGNMRHPS